MELIEPDDDRREIPYQLQMKSRSEGQMEGRKRGRYKQKRERKDMKEER